MLQLCCDDKLTLAHAQRVLLKDSRSFAKVRWIQDGFRNTVGATPAGQTMRNLFGQVDGTVNPYPGEEDHEKVVYGQDGFEPWIENGTSLVLRRIHMNLDTWDEADTPAREDSVGRKLADGAPLTGSKEHDEPDFEAKGRSGSGDRLLQPHPTLAHRQSGREDLPQGVQLRPTGGGRFRHEPFR